MSAKNQTDRPRYQPRATEMDDRLRVLERRVRQLRLLRLAKASRH